MDGLRPTRAGFQDGLRPNYGQLDDYTNYSHQTGRHSLIPFRPLTMSRNAPATVPPGLYERQSNPNDRRQVADVCDDPVDNYEWQARRTRQPLQPPRLANVSLDARGRLALYPASSNYQAEYQSPESPRVTSYQSHFAPELDSSSPSTRIASSPSLAVTQRRHIQDLRRTNDAITHTISTPRRPDFGLENSRDIPKRISLDHAPPTVQGIRLVSLHELPDRCRSVFPFPLLNAVQSRCFNTIYKSNDNLVLSAPTGSGKTAILELAICRLSLDHNFEQYKILYMAPTKSLCSERQRDWQAKFRSLNLKSAELTGDTDQGQIQHVQSANIIITTPEKWDTMTRKWKDHRKLMQMVKLFLIDEVHILKDARGATLEAVVSRMKSVDSDIRFVALSATVPNSKDIATWLGKSHIEQHLPAQLERFGEEFRPVKLQKFVYGLPPKGNDFAMESVCDAKLPEIISKHSHKKPIMVFCYTRKSTILTANLLTNLWMSSSMRDRPWPAPQKVLVTLDPDLRETLKSGVAFHHAGLSSQDRVAVEKGFLEGHVHVICCTSTLAVGVNLPCHLVIVKNTVNWQEDGLREYADLEMMQMLGRAGRPQFDDSAVAVIMTRQDKVKKYEKMVSGEELLESCLHLNLIDHLNAEIGLGTVHDLQSAKQWLKGTFLYTRLSQNPYHYKLDDDARGQSLEDRIERICERDISLLRSTRLISPQGQLKSTEFGDAMARFYVKFETMRYIIGLEPGAKMSEILSALCQAEEFHEVRFRSGEKGLYKVLNAANGLKFPIKTSLELAAHKRSVIIQAELGGVEFPVEEQYGKHKRQHQQDRTTLFVHLNRLIRCVVDCQLALHDGPATRHALELARSLAAKVWDNSPLLMKQIPGLGPVAVRKLVSASINNLEELEAAQPSRIALILSKNPASTQKLLADVSKFPKLRISVKLMSEDTKLDKSPNIRIKAEIGFLNEVIPTEFGRKPVFVCFLAERSDGFLIDFRRWPAKRIGNGEDILLSADLLDLTQYMTCYVMCDEIAGTLCYAEIKHNLPASSFPRGIELESEQHDTLSKSHKPSMNISRRRSKGGNSTTQAIEEIDILDDDFDDDINDGDLMAAVQRMERSRAERFGHAKPVKEPIRLRNDTTRFIDIDKEAKVNHQAAAPRRLGNGNWACNHACKDKNKCKHLCCREGLDKPPKIPKKSKSTKQNAGSKAPIRSSVKAPAPGGSKKIPSGLHLKKPHDAREAFEDDMMSVSTGRSEESFPVGASSNSMYNHRGEKVKKSNSLVNRVHQAGTEPYQESIEGEHTYSDDFPDVSDLLENVEAKKGASEAEEFAFKEFDDDLAAFQADMTDYNIFGDAEDFHNTHKEAKNDNIRASRASRKRTFGNTHYSTKLFVTTSSPEKSSSWSAQTVHQSRVPTEVPKEASKENQPPKKRQRLDSADAGELSEVSGGLGQQGPESHKAEEVQLDPMDGIDHELFAEYADIIEFI